VQFSVDSIDRIFRPHLLGNPQDDQPLLPKCGVRGSGSLALLGVVRRRLIELNDELCCLAVEIGDVALHLLVDPEGDAQLPISKPAPYCLLAIRGGH
jgi:hypothetical protein